MLIRNATVIAIGCFLVSASVLNGDDAAANGVPPAPAPRVEADDAVNGRPVPPPPPKPQRQPPAEGAKAAKSKAAKPKPVFEAFTDPAAAGADFMVQGEYTGQVTTDGALVWYGVQVVAGGDGQFDVVIFRGGLPGNDWDGETRSASTMEPIEGGYRFAWGEAVAELKAKTIHVRDAQGTVLGRLTKVRRSSRTLGQAPPEGAVVLFDGSSTDSLDGAEVTAEGLLTQGFTTRETFGDFTLHAEFQTPFMPTARGQQRGNSGLYMQGRYETQILDSFGLLGKNNEAGGIYEISDPSLNLCFPPLAWQTYDIDFTAARFDSAGNKTADARMTVRLNGVLVQDDVPVPRATRAAKLPEGPEPGPLYVQDHGNPVRFRNIWIVPKDNTPRLPPPPRRMTARAPAPPATNGTAADEDMPRVTDDWIPLFNGETLAGWHKNPAAIGHGTGGRWGVEDGDLVGEQDPPGSGNGGILLTDARFGDFELSIDLKPDWGVDSGLFLRSTDQGQCFQMMVDYHDAGNVGHIYGEGTGGFTNRPFSIYAASPTGEPLATLRTESTENDFAGYSLDAEDWLRAWKVGEWNTVVVRVVGQPPVITTWLNGVRVMTFDGSMFEHPKYDAEAVAQTLGDQGHIAVQVHGGTTWPDGAKCRWRNILIRPLDGSR